MPFTDDENILKLINPIRNPARTGNSWIKYIDRFVAELKEDAVLNLNPEFQRGVVWTEDQQTNFMENLIRGLVHHETNIIRLNDPSLAWGHGNKVQPDSDLPNETMCIDGLQRFTAMQKYMHKELKPFGLSFDEIESTPYGVKAKAMTFTVAWYDFQYEHELIEFYMAINWGGTPHSESEKARVLGLYDKAKARKE